MALIVFFPAEVAPPMHGGSGHPLVTGTLLPGQVAMQRLLVPWTAQSAAQSALMQQLPMGKHVL